MTYSLDALVDPRRMVDQMGGAPLAVRLGDQTAYLKCDDPRSIDYLRALFTPENPLWGFGTPSEHPDLTVYDITVDEDRFADLTAALARRASRLIESRFHIQAPSLAYELDNGVRAFVTANADPVTGSNLVIRTEAGVGCVNTRCGYSYLALARHLREYGLRRAESMGWTGLHSSCADTPRGGVLIIGRSGAGKSTLSMALAMEPGGKFVANDRVMVYSGNSIRACAMPVPIRLNAGTVKALQRTESSSWPLIRPQPSLEHSDWASFGGQAKLSVLASEWRRHGGLRLADEVDVKAILLPQIRHGDFPLEIGLLDGRAARSLIKEQVMTPDDDVFVDDWLAARTTGRAQLEARSEATLTAMLELPLIHLRFGTSIDISDVVIAVSDCVAHVATRANPAAGEGAGSRGPMPAAAFPLPE